MSSSWQSDLRLTKLARLYCGYSGNTNQTTAIQNEWSIFPYPTTGYTIWREHDFDISPTTSEITYTGLVPKWVRISATCNIYKGSGSGPNRNVEVQWRLNGVPVGPVRAMHMSSADNTIITGIGQAYLSSGDIISPWIRNIENDDKILLKNCQFEIVQDPDEIWTPSL